MPFSDEEQQSAPRPALEVINRARRWRIILLIAMGWMIIGLAFATSRIGKLDGWLRERTEYANRRDAAWNARFERHDVLFERIAKLLDDIDARKKPR